MNPLHSYSLATGAARPASPAPLSPRSTSHCAQTTTTVAVESVPRMERSSRHGVAKPPLAPCLMDALTPANCAAIEAAPPWFVLMGTTEIPLAQKCALIVFDVAHNRVLAPEQLHALMHVSLMMAQRDKKVAASAERFWLFLYTDQPHTARALGNLFGLLADPLSRAYTHGLLGAYLHPAGQSDWSLSSRYAALASICFAQGRIVGPSPACAQALLDSIPPTYRRHAFSMLAMFLAMTQQDEAALSYCLQMGAEPFWPAIELGSRGAFLSVLDLLLDKGSVSVLRPYVERLCSPVDVVILTAMRSHPRVQADRVLRDKVEKQLWQIGCVDAADKPQTF